VDGLFRQFQGQGFVVQCASSVEKEIDANVFCRFNKHRIHWQIPFVYRADPKRQPWVSGASAGEEV
jgi:hypothetical protein